MAEIKQHQKWEYLETISWKNDLYYKLTELGLAGWELVNLIMIDQQVHLVFKRPLIKG